MKFARLPRAVAFGSAILLGLSGCGREAQRLQAENESLRAAMAEAAARAETESQSAAARAVQVKQLEADAQDVLRLRAEVAKLRTATKDTETIRAENQRLKLENQALRQGTAAAAPAAGRPTQGHFPKESWSYAGYQTPESALVSALYSMQQGNPRQYFDSLTAEEQQRMAKNWENKTPEEIAAKHVNDTARITGMKILNSQELSPGQMVMSVYIEGIDRAEKVSMKLVNGEWKFGGYVREPGK